jgi:hypothetical protein
MFSRGDNGQEKAPAFLQPYFGVLILAVQAMVGHAAGESAHLWPLRVGERSWEATGTLAVWYVKSSVENAGRFTFSTTWAQTHGSVIRAG